ncbi:hypothetical protein [Nonomuraea sp. SBT364]|uniref:hypothetical protein n=1 Tax=Nonomuraea sp. SBT364 TaxID=1580530 RepID=UPI000A8C2AAA|nr:hypothetical protein [Nonomuraea sp. SBT364]
MRAPKWLSGGLAAGALLVVAGAAAPAAAAGGSICLYSEIQSVCVSASPGHVKLSRTVTSARNSSPYAARLIPAEGASVGCLEPGETESYARAHRISGIQIFPGATCPV